MSKLSNMTWPAYSSRVGYDGGQEERGDTESLECCCRG